MRRLDQRDALLVVHDVQRLALQLDRVAIVLILAIDLEAAQVDALFHTRGRLPGGGLALGHLAHALPAGVVDVPGRLR